MNIQRNSMNIQVGRVPRLHLPPDDQPASGVEFRPRGASGGGCVGVRAEARTADVLRLSRPAGPGWSRFTASRPRLVAFHPKTVGIYGKNSGLFTAFSFCEKCRSRHGRGFTHFTDGLPGSNSYKFHGQSFWIFTNFRFVKSAENLRKMFWTFHSF